MNNPLTDMKRCIETVLFLIEEMETDIRNKNVPASINADLLNRATVEGAIREKPVEVNFSKLIDDTIKVDYPYLPDRVGLSRRINSAIQLALSFQLNQKELKKCRQ